MSMLGSPSFLAWLQTASPKEVARLKKLGQDKAFPKGTPWAR